MNRKTAKVTRLRKRHRRQIEQEAVILMQILTCTPETTRRMIRETLTNEEINTLIGLTQKIQDGIIREIIQRAKP